MAIRGWTAVVSSALAFGAGLGLGLVPQWIGGSTARPPEPSSAAAQTEEMTLLLRDVHRAIELLSNELRRRPGEPVTAPVEPSQRRLPEGTAPAANSTELAFALNSLADAIRELRAGEGAAAGKRAEELLKPTFVDREAAFAATGMERAADSGNDEVLEKARADLNHSHMFMTSQAVLSRYGTPDSINFDDGGESWYYRLPREEHILEFVIRFHQGIAFQCDFDF